VVPNVLGGEQVVTQLAGLISGSRFPAQENVHNFRNWLETVRASLFFTLVIGGVALLHAHPFSW
jgi:hypothetical protein